MKEKIKNILKKNKVLYKLAQYINLSTFVRYKTIKRNRRLLKYGRDVLIDFDEACKEGNIAYWLEFGTLLGAIREKNFIAYDLDIDVGIYLKDYKNSNELIFEKFGFKKIRTFLIDDGKYGREETYRKKGVDIDIFYFNKKEENVCCHVFSNQDGLSWNETIIKYGGLIAREFKFPKFDITKIDFLEYQFPVPDNYHIHLETNYGNYMIKDKEYLYTKARNQKILENKVGIMI